MPATRINPIVVVPLQLIIIMYALIFTKVEGCVRDAEAILTVLQAYLLAAIKHRLDGTTRCRTYHLVVNLKMTELQRHIPECIDVGRIKHSDTIGTTEYQTTIWQLARGTISKLITSQSVGLIKCSHYPSFGIQTVQTLHSTYPEVTLPVFLDTSYVRTREASNSAHLVGLRMIAQQTIAHGTNPDIAISILMHIGRDIHTTTDTTLHAGNIHRTQLPRLRIHFHDRLIESRYQHRTILQL